MEYLELATLLRERREAIGTTKAEISRRIKSSDSYISMVENGERRPSKEKLERWAQALGWGEEYTNLLLVLAGHITVAPEEQIASLGVPESSDELDFPQPRSLERYNLVQQLQKLLDSGMEVSDEQWKQAVSLLQSYFAWLPSYIGVESSQNEVSSSTEAKQVRQSGIKKGKKSKSRVPSSVIQQVAVGNAPPFSDNQGVMSIGDAGGSAQATESGIIELVSDNDLVNLALDLRKLGKPSKTDSGRIIFTFQANKSLFIQTQRLENLWKEMLQGKLNDGWHIVQLVWLDNADHKRTEGIVDTALPFLSSGGKYEIRYTIDKPDRPIQEFLVANPDNADYGLAASIQLDGIVATFDPARSNSVEVRETFDSIARDLNQRAKDFPLLFTPHKREQDDLDAAELWNTTIKDVEGQEGGLRLMMNGFGDNTLPDHLFEAQLKLVLNAALKDKGEAKANLIRYVIACKKQRRQTFLEYIQQEDVEEEEAVYHIVPIDFLDWYKKNGFHSRDSSPYIFKGEKASDTQQAEHLRAIVALMDTYPNTYKLGLLAPGLFGTGKSYWLVKGGHTVLMEHLVSSEVDILINEEVVAQAYRAAFDELWKSGAVEIDQDKVKEILVKQVEKLEKK